MKLAIMQPYVFPYLGYYQLVAAVDTFVFFDDVNFITRGWINRNRLLHKDEPLKFTIPLEGASQNKLINEIKIADFKSWRKTFVKTIEVNYRKAPNFTFVSNWLDQFLLRDFTFISELATESVQSIAKLLGLQAQFKKSSAINYKNGNSLNGEQKIISISKILGANTYVNPKNGKELYNCKHFEEAQIQLSFINMHDIIYKQTNVNKFIPDLSIIDVLMFNSVDEVKELLTRFALN